VGYTGGDAPNPTYKSVCRGDGHTEALKVAYDPSVLPYEDLMQRVIKQASPFAAKAQYKSAVWASTPEQEAAAKKVAKAMGKDVPVMPTSKWYDAEDYHQKYVEKQRR